MKFLEKSGRDQLLHIGGGIRLGQRILPKVGQLAVQSKNGGLPHREVNVGGVALQRVMNECSQVGVLFYLLVIIAAISSAISLMEVVPSSTRRRALSRRVCIPSAMAVSRSAPVSQRWEIIVRIRGVISMIS